MLFGKDELDILALSPDAKTLVLVEVRETMDRNRILENTIGPRKRAAMLRVAKYVRGQAKKHHCEIRVDLVTVCLSEKSPFISHFKSI